LKQLAAASNAARLAELGKQIEQVRQAKLESAEQLATMLEPLAQAMAALTDETRQTLVEIEHRSREQSAQFRAQIEAAAKAWKDAAAQTSDAAESLNRAGHRMEWIHYLVR
jgi:cell division protein FtsX